MGASLFLQRPLPPAAAAGERGMPPLLRRDRDFTNHAGVQVRDVDVGGRWVGAHRHLALEHVVSRAQILLDGHDARDVVAVEDAGTRASGYRPLLIVLV